MLSLNFSTFRKRFRNPLHGTIDYDHNIEKHDQDFKK